jgi:hypothetical protein
VDKPLKDYTLGEIREMCREHDKDCSGCPCCIEHGKILTACFMGNTDPQSWEFEGDRKFTEQEVQYAEFIHNLFAYDAITRNTNGALYAGYCATVKLVDLIQTDAFPSIKRGESFTIDEIIGNDLKEC